MSTLLEQAVDAEERATAPADGWRRVARLYAAAVVQLRRQVPGRIDPPRLDASPFLRFVRTADPGHRLTPENQPSAHAALEAVLTEVGTALAGIRKEPGHAGVAAEVADVATGIVEHLGPPLFRRLHRLLLLDDGTEGPPGRGPAFRVDLPGDERFLLVLTWADPLADTPKTAREPTVSAPGRRPPGAAWADLDPPDGWQPEPPQARPRFVRVVPFHGDEAPAVHYLGATHPELDRRLARLDPDEGITLAALPLHPDLEFTIHHHGADRDGLERVSIGAPEAWPDGWADDLRTQVQACSEARVVLAVLPELSAHPDVVAVAREALAACTNGFPALLALGSWHAPVTGLETFRNRLVVVGRLPGGGITEVLHHDKFEPFVHAGVREHLHPGSAGFGYLVTALGPLAFGICKDWFLLRSAGDGDAARAFRALAPRVAACPLLTGNTADLLDLVPGLFRATGTAMVAANACGNARRLSKTARATCAPGPASPGQDLRSFVTASRHRFTVCAVRDAPPCTVSPAHGATTARAACGGMACTAGHPVIARVVPR